MTTTGRRRYSAAVEHDDEARAFLIARDLIAQHGDDVARFLQEKIDSLTEAGDYEQLSVWFVIRNAVTLSLGSDPTLH
jgi:hypothetical protein